MAKKLTLAFIAQPVAGDSFSYTVFLDNSAMLYNSGVSNVAPVFSAFGTPNTNPTGIEIKATLSETIDNVLDFLKLNFKRDVVKYTRVGDSIEVLINTDQSARITGSPSSSRITMFIVDAPLEIDEEAESFITLRYFFTYLNIVNDLYLCNIYKKNNTEEPIEINGTATIEKGGVKDHLETIKGTGLSLQLEATATLTLDDLYTQDEQDFTVELQKNGVIIFKGFLKPDGVFQSYTRDRWILSLDCIDGLGTLENLSFVRPTGMIFVGKMTALDIIYNCLKRTGISLPINTSVNILYNGLTPSDDLDILTQVNFNSDRFIKTDGETIMSCEEVLKSVLYLFTASITQENGEWHIYRANEIYTAQNVLFRRYDILNVFVETVTLSLNKTLGSQINGFYPHHFGGDQTIEIKGGVSAFRLGYKYGFVKGLLENSTLVHNGSLVYQYWTVYDSFNLINDSSRRSGFTIQNSTFGVTSNMIKSDAIPAIIGDALGMKIKYIATSGRFLRMRIQNGNYFLKYNPRNSAAPLSEAEELAEWVTDAAATYTIWLFGTGTISLNIPRLVVTGDLTFSIIQTYPSGGRTIINGFDIFPNTGAKPEQGEFHTVSRGRRISTLIKDNKTVYNGDNAGIMYLGAIYKANGTTPTNLWFRKGNSDRFPLLRITAEEELRIAQKPLKVFKGSIFGFIPYLSVISINNFPGLFMPIEYSYDTMTNTVRTKLLELYSPEVEDILYKFTFDYGDTVKPTIAK